MSHSEQIDQLCKALAAAQGELTNAPFDRTNPHFRNKYASLASIRDTVRKVLSKHGLAVTQVIQKTTSATGVESWYLAATLHHGNQWIQSDYPLPSMAKPQEFGSALTYGCRYTLCALVGVVGDEDDDGEAAMPAHLPKKDAKELYQRLQGEIDDKISVLELDDWGNFEPNKERIYTLPPDWQQHIRLRFAEKRADLENQYNEYEEHLEKVGGKQ